MRNAEDKLGAAEERKDILQKEMITYRETQQQLSQQIEVSVACFRRGYTPPPPPRKQSFLGYIGITTSI